MHVCNVLFLCGYVIHATNLFLKNISEAIVVQWFEPLTEHNTEMVL